jgi:hypothetical protein
LQDDLALDRRAQRLDGVLVPGTGLLRGELPAAVTGMHDLVPAGQVVAVHPGDVEDRNSGAPGVLEQPGDVRGSDIGVLTHRAAVRRDRLEKRNAGLGEHPGIVVDHQYRGSAPEPDALTRLGRRQIAYILITVGAAVYLRRVKAPIASAVVVGGLATAWMCYVLFKNIYPVPDAPYNLLPWIFVGDLIDAGAWYAIVKARLGRGSDTESGSSSSPLLSADFAVEAAD